MSNKLLDSKRKTDLFHKILIIFNNITVFLTMHQETITSKYLFLVYLNMNHFKVDKGNYIFYKYSLIFKYLFTNILLIVLF